MIKDKRELCKQRKTIKMLHSKCKGRNTRYEQVYEESGAGCRRRFTPSERKCSGGAEPIRWTTAEIHNDLLKQTKTLTIDCAFVMLYCNLYEHTLVSGVSNFPAEFSSNSH